MKKLKNYFRDIVHRPKKWDLLYIPKEYFTLRRFINKYKTLISYFLSLVIKKPIVWGYPWYIRVEPTNYCNLKCPQCPTSNEMFANKGNMSFECFKKIVDESYKDAYIIQLFHSGESFLNKDLCKMINYAHQKRMFTLISANLNFIPPAEEVVKSGLSHLVIAIDGITQETYGKYRINGLIEKVLSNTNAIIKAKKDLNSSFPTVDLQMVPMRHNEHEIEGFKNLAKELGADRYCLKYPEVCQVQDMDKFMPENQEFHQYHVSDKLEFNSRGLNRCFMLWHALVVLWDGEGKVCNKDYSNLKIGNINNTALLALYNSKVINNLRQSILKNRNNVEICTNCPFERESNLQPVAVKV